MLELVGTVGPGGELLKLRSDYCEDLSRVLGAYFQKLWSGVAVSCPGEQHDHEAGDLFVDAIEQQ